MDLKDFTQSKFLAKTDVPEAGVTLTIAGFGIEEMRDKSKKPFVTWVQPYKPMLLNKVNRDRLAVICGTTQTEGMVGKQVHVFNDPMVEMAGQVVGGLRIRPVGNVSQVPGMTPELEAALALVKSRAAAATAKAEPNDDIPF